MHRTTLLLACLLLAGATAGCSSEKSYDETVKDCTAALAKRADGDKAKPSACEGVKADDYTALLMSQVMDDNGWVDETGGVDMGKILEDSTSQP